MSSRLSVACTIAIAVSTAFGALGAARSARSAVATLAEPLAGGDRERVDRAIAVATRRYDEWLGPATASEHLVLRLKAPLWSSPPTMHLESQVAFELARARFAGILGRVETARFVDGVAWHLQSHVVEELFDLAHHQPGHHADAVGLFGGHLQWGVPSIVLSRRARDERAPPDVACAAAAVATLENIVGWPALAAALRVVSSQRLATDQPAVAELLERALGIPLDWFFDTLDPGFRVNHRLVSVGRSVEECGTGRCHRLAVVLARDGRSIFGEGEPSIAYPIPLRMEFAGGAVATVSWDGRDVEKRVTVESASEAIAVTLDPDRALRVDQHPLDQRWRSERNSHRRPDKFLAAWIIWLQNAALTYGVLL